MASAPPGGPVAKLLKHIVIALLMAFGLGLAVGTAVRLRLEAPTRYIGLHAIGADDQRLSRCHSTSPIPPRAFSSRAKTKSRSESRLT